MPVPSLSVPELVSLPVKYVFFVPRFEFFGVDCCDDGNRPAMSKSELYKYWPPFVVARDVASFTGFMHFYGKFIPYFEHRATPLWALAELKMTAPIEN